MRLFKCVCNCSEYCHSTVNISRDWSIMAWKIVDVHITVTLIALTGADGWGWDLHLKCAAVDSLTS